MARLRSKARRGKGGVRLLKYLNHLLTGPCAYCHELGCDSIDHVVPVSKGGRTVASNLVACHSKCNRRKGDSDV